MIYITGKRLFNFNSNINKCTLILVRIKIYNIVKFYNVELPYGSGQPKPNDMKQPQQLVDYSSPSRNLRRR